MLIVTGLNVAVAVRVMVGEGDSVGVRVTVGVSVIVGFLVLVRVGIFVRVTVGVRIGVRVVEDGLLCVHPRSNTDRNRNPANSRMVFFISYILSRIPSPVLTHHIPSFYKRIRG